MVSVLEPWQAGPQVTAGAKGQESTRFLNDNEVRGLAVLDISAGYQAAVTEVLWRRCRERQTA